MPEMMTSEEAAAYLRTSVESIRRMAREGRVPAARVGRSWRFRKTELDEWLEVGGDASEDLVDRWLVQLAEERAARTKPEELVRMTQAAPNWREHITVSPDIQGGKPVIKGTRMPVHIVVGSLAGGMSVEEVCEQYYLTQAQVRAALGYSAEVSACPPPSTAA